MGEIAVAVVIIAAGLGAYWRAQRSGTWSWREFGVALLGALILIAVVVPAALLIADTSGPDQAGIATVVIVVLALVGTFALAFWMKRRKAGAAPPRS
jgi:Na+/melibiose symporter-like transporter